MVISIGTTYYFIYLVALALLTILVGVFLKGKEESTKKKFLIILSFVGLVLNFAKLFIPEYNEALPLSISEVTFNSICSVLAIITPFVLLMDNKYTKDFVFYMGIIAGLATLIYPLEIFDKEALDVEVIRFYLAHVIILIISIYMVKWGLHSLSIKRIIIFPISFLLVLGVIMMNQVVLQGMGFFTVEEMLANESSIYNLIFGPTEELLEALAKIDVKAIEWLVPKPFRTYSVGVFKGMENYVPILWMTIPCFIGLPLLALIIYFIFTKFISKSSKANDSF